MSSKSSRDGRRLSNLAFASEIFFGAGGFCFWADDSLGAGFGDGSVAVSPRTMTVAGCGAALPLDARVSLPCGSAISELMGHTSMMGNKTQSLGASRGEQRRTRAQSGVSLHSQAHSVPVKPLHAALWRRSH